VPVSRFASAPRQVQWVGLERRFKWQGKQLGIRKLAKELVPAKQALYDVCPVEAIHAVGPHNSRLTSLDAKF
jgi:hypothetical protein